MFPAQVYWKACEWLPNAGMESFENKFACTSWDWLLHVEMECPGDWLSARLPRVLGYMRGMGLCVGKEDRSVIAVLWRRASAVGNLLGWLHHVWESCASDAIAQTENATMEFHGVLL